MKKSLISFFFLFAFFHNVPTLWIWSYSPQVGMIHRENHWKIVRNQAADQQMLKQRLPRNTSLSNNPMDRSGFASCQENSTVLTALWCGSVLSSTCFVEQCVNNLVISPSSVTVHQCTNED